MSPAKKPSTSRAAGKKTTVKKAASKAGSKTTKSSAAKTSKKTASRTAPLKTSGKKTTGKKPSSTRAAAAPRAAAGSEGKSVKKKSQVQGTATPSPRRRGKRPGLPPMTLKKTTAKKASPSRPAKFDAHELEDIRRRLESERSELEQRIEEIEANVFEKTQSDLTGEAGFDEDFADAGTATFDRERELSIQNNIRDIIEQINRAIARIDQGSYGTCERCGKPIDASRLKALPHALLCMDCKRREERAR
jgi:RNA polymerase-binding protein DksA